MYIYICICVFVYCIYIYIYIYKQSGQNLVNTRSSVLKLRHPLGNTCYGQKTYPI